MASCKRKAWTCNVFLTLMGRFALLSCYIFVCDASTAASILFEVALVLGEFV